jgi:hypothetical protein
MPAPTHSFPSIPGGPQAQGIQPAQTQVPAEPIARAAGPIARIWAAIPAWARAVIAAVIVIGIIAIGIASCGRSGGTHRNGGNRGGGQRPGERTRPGDERRKRERRQLEKRRRQGAERRQERRERVIGVADWIFTAWDWITRWIGTPTNPDEAPKLPPPQNRPDRRREDRWRRGKESERRRKDRERHPWKYFWPWWPPD